DFYIRDGAGALIAQVDILMVILSHGPNGHGAYMENGIKKSAGSVNLDEWKNCNCNAAATLVNPDEQFVQRTPWNHPSNAFDRFDDYLDYMSLGDFMGAEELRTETAPLTH